MLLFWQVLHVYGTPYEMGYAQGELMLNEARKMVNDTWAYLEEQIAEAIDLNTL